MAIAYLGLGSNVGDRLGYLAGAVRKMREGTEVKTLRLSGIYETEPVGIKAQPTFLNTVVEALTSLSPVMLLERVKGIEKELGRRERMRWGPREIDIDILLFGEEQVEAPPLSIPHPEMTRRRFVLEPLAEIAPGVMHPSERRTIVELLRDCRDESRVERSGTLTEAFLSLVEG